MKSIRSWLALGLLGVVALLSIQPAHANSAPPPRRIWFYFDKGVLPLAVQIIGCSDAACTQINLLREYGRCESGDCIDTPQALTAASDYFDCAEGRCLFATYAELPPYIKLAAQFADGDRSSNVQAIDQGQRWSTTAWRLVDNGSTLQISLAADISAEQLRVGKSGQILEWLLPSGLLTLVVEALVIAILLHWAVKLPWSALPSWIAIVALTQLLSYPATWMFFPTLSGWSTSSERGAGALAVVFAILMAIWLVAARYARARSLRLVLGISAGIVLAIGCLSSVPLMMVTGYGQLIPSAASGLAFPLVLVLAEAFAVIFETLFIYGFSKRQFTLPLTFFLVLAANAASFGIGMLVFTPLALR